MALVAIFVALFHGIWPLFVATLDSRLAFVFFGIPILVLAFVLVSGWVLIKFLIVASRISAVVASGSALLSLYSWMALLDWFRYLGSSVGLSVKELVGHVADSSIFVVPLWVLYTGAVFFAWEEPVDSQDAHSDLGRCPVDEAGPS